MASIVNSIPLPPFITLGVFGKVVFDLYSINFDFSNILSFESSDLSSRPLAFVGAIGVAFVVLAYGPREMGVPLGLLGGAAGAYLSTMLPTSPM